MSKYSDGACSTSIGLSSSIEPVPVSPLRASIPSAGDIGLIDHNIIYDAYQVVRVVSATGKMWMVEQFDRYANGKWGAPGRRKVSRWIPLPDGVNVEGVVSTLQRLGEQLRENERAARAGFHQLVAEYAQSYAKAIEAREGGAASGSIHESAVPKEFAQSQALEPPPSQQGAD